VTDIAANIARVRARIDAACATAGRDPSGVTLIAVSKTFGAEAVRAARDAGQLDLGESYAQELRDKAREIEGVRWHFIGRLQKNKAKYVAPVAYRVHALEEVGQAEALLKRAPAEGLKALVSVNVGGEESKGGVDPAVALDRCAELQALDGLDIVGLMTLPPFREDPEEVAPFFEELADLAARGRARGLPLHELSMGMSHDFEVAVRHGATWVRVGTAIFGERR
jgi:pyridoxal phosphate enzyme (YggS family)